MSFPNLAPFKRMLSPGILLQKYMIVKQCPAIQGLCKNPTLGSSKFFSFKIFEKWWYSCEIQFSIHQPTTLLWGIPCSIFQPSWPVKGGKIRGKDLASSSASGSCSGSASRISRAPHRCKHGKPMGFLTDTMSYPWTKSKVYSNYIAWNKYHGCRWKFSA